MAAAEVVTNKVLSGANALRLRGSTNGTANPAIVLANVDISGYTNVTVTVPFAADGPDSGDDLYVAASYDGGATWSPSALGTQIADGAGNLKLEYNVLLAETNQLQGTPYVLSVADVRTQLMVRIVFFDANSASNYNDFYYVDEIQLKGQVAAPPPPVVVITTPNQTVAAGTASIAISGTNSATVVGTMRWTNSLTGTAGTMAAAASWSTNLALGVGTNAITVSGTNSAGTLASSSVQIIRPPDTPVVTITTPNQTVAAGTASIAVSGTNNAAVVGTMRWTNSLAGAGGTFAAAASWTATVSLAVGTNAITVSGTNSAGTLAGDSVQIIRPPTSAGPTTILADDFEDGDLSGWTQDIAGNWANSTTTPITGTRSLKHNLSGVAATNYIYAQPQYNVSADKTIWRFKLKNGNWDPSADNRFHVYLMASGSDLKGSVNGYAVGVNFTGTDDLVKLWRITGGGIGATVLTSAVDWNAATTMAIEVTRSAAGLWELKTNPDGTFSGLVSAGTATDTTHTDTSYFGLYFKCTSTRAGDVWLDDVLIRQGEITADTDSDSDGLPDWWEELYFDAPTGASPDADDDEDGMSNLAEFIAGTHPRQAGSVLALAPAAVEKGATTNLVFRWPAVSGRVYSIWMATSLTGTYSQVVGGLPASDGPENAHTNAAPGAPGTYYYGIRVSWPEAP
jgi:hypothetical protein